MKIINIFLFTLIIFFLCTCTQETVKSDFDKELFLSPPTEVGVHAWWHWMDGQITREGITLDLESMSKQGIVQVTILNIGMSTGENSVTKKIAFNSDDWYQMFDWALIEAKRLGISIGVHNCDGWSESGGPWISPEMSMKKFVFSKLSFSGNTENVVLPKPICETGFYRDVAVMAYKRKNEQNTIQGECSKIMVNDSIDGMTLVDGNPESMIEVREGDVFTFSNAGKEIKTKISLLQNFKGAFYFPGPKTIEYTIKASSDGVFYRKITDVVTNTFYDIDIIDIPPTKSKYFQVEVKKIHKLRPWHHAALAELQLLNEDEKPVYNPTILHLREKAASARIIDVDKLYTFNTNLNQDEIIDKTSVIDLTERMKPDGTLNWKCPEGNWSVIRFGYTTTGAKNGPATKEGIGLECDKMDTTALNIHFSHFPKKLIEHAGDYTGTTFKFFLIDSWERGYQTWTKRMPCEFEKLRGYDLLPWIPVLCGETVESTKASEAFLYDFRKTIADLFEQNYYMHFKDLCHRNGLELHGEVIYGDTGPFPPVDVLKSNNYMDMPMYEFWADMNDDKMVEYTPAADLMSNFPVFAANFYNKSIIGTEAFTGFAHFSESPADLKLFGDRAFCSGLNQMILHSYVHQPGAKKPGLTLGQHGSHFNRYYPAWNHYKGWMEYLDRVQYVLQKGNISADILYYLGDQYPQFFKNKTIDSLPSTYQSVPCNFDVLKKLSVRNHKIYFSENQSFSILVLPDQKILEYETLHEIKRLLKEGALVYGEKPSNMFSLKATRENETEFENLTNEIWFDYLEGKSGKNNFGKGTMVWGESFIELINNTNINPDFSTNYPDSLNLMYIHKATDKDDVFYVVNQKDSMYYRECTFKVPEKRIPAIWDPMSGEVKAVTCYTYAAGQIHIPIEFKPKQSQFFIFTRQEKQEHICRVESEGEILFPSNDSTQIVDFPKIDYNNNGEFSCISTTKRKFKLTTNKGNVVDVYSNVPDTFKINDVSGKIIFNPLNSNESDTLEIDELKSFTDFVKTEIKYFSGEAVYEIDFEITDDFLDNKKLILLSLGDFDATAEVVLNNHLLGTVWFPGNPIQTGQFLKKNNHLSITLGTTARNRIIGDIVQFGELKNVWTSGPIKNFLNENSKLKPSGIIGPIQLIKI